jgi:type I restriction enzyme S subunit
VSLNETQIGEVPEEWDVLQVADFADIKAGGTPSRSKPEYWNGNIPWIKTGEINYNIITKTEETITEEGFRNSSVKLIPAGTLLMAMYGQGVTRGRVAISGIDATLNQACAAFFLPKTISTDFMFHYFSYHYETIRNMGHGAHQKNLSATLIKTIPVTLPPFNKQQLISNYLSSVNEKIQVETQRKAAYELLFNSLLHHLMTGKIRLVNVSK